MSTKTHGSKRLGRDVFEHFFLAFFMLWDSSLTSEKSFSLLILFYGRSKRCHTIFGLFFLFSSPTRVVVGRRSFHCTIFSPICLFLFVCPLSLSLSPSLANVLFLFVNVQCEIVVALHVTTFFILSSFFRFFLF